MTPRLLRIKQAVRRAIELSGHIDGAAATCERSRSTVGDWNNLNQKVFPTLDSVLALDEVAIGMGHAPPQLSRMAAELGFVILRLPDCGAGEDALSRALLEASAEFGDIAGEVRDATRDGAVSAAERDRIIAQIDEAATALQQLRGVVSAGEGKD